ncbi:succinylglutamate desuccinylase/aspartoacylase family protein [Spongiibacter sp. KMU-158]|uniref:Succinylglutamate desuccinylase/aspartoacylase family protein n=1 Tax=Spongiibacter pelagi TaxID=2760804 RepID=A0A927C0J1_9GAMM|nr:succinylglutamate desuccinylase/aspartoacylase family protein [Spongiibacter pelagi]MBD2857948.1 succinylglutamate desuccinylase/aspartoacylase family protein [Spongiibacter pelagi]
MPRLDAYFLARCLGFSFVIAMSPPLLAAGGATAAAAASASQSAKEEKPVAQEPSQTEEVAVVEPQIEKAPNVDLSKVAPVPEPKIIEPVETVAPVAETTVPETATAPVEQGALNTPFVILGAEVEPSASSRVAWSPDNNISGLAAPAPVLVVNGKYAGPTLCLTGAIHGDELNGIEIIRRVVYDLDPKSLKGRIIAVPIVNLQGFREGSRYLPDRRDLNRFFPGDVKGSLASRIAHSLFYKVIKQCDYLVDVHTGSMLRDNLPQVRADMLNESVANFAKLIDNVAIVHSKGDSGMLRVAAVAENIPSLTLEVGESLRIQEDQIKAGVTASQTLLERLGMYRYFGVWGKPTPVFYQSEWIRAPRGGILFSNTRLGDVVKVDQKLATIIDPITNEKSDIIADVAGKVIGMANNQVVMPGFAAFHIGIHSKDETTIEPEASKDLDPAEEPITE